ncbi:MULTISPECIES: adenylyltransferase/cytidyltransferase family protein [Bacteroides]|jgi:glycerol-3-phosphate cytidylyltransferase|uniref:adenylyltransferase/cytidyltransferase family protein n=1 Tax=Bacteroides TaxID=816 RepID=UPI000E5518F4|nr:MULTISPECIES: adenylyltransferase/cytidyltransferase family protein [Bacteroides]MBS6563330.1 adenylyltransferase/cytidyltransferase family protein [Staphylococcus sp.]RHL05888.1 glycerol-3-phosphate cytidylyltransferase [Bacteroides sp. AF39-11AC]
MKKYKIGYTTGTFDLFHIGHLNILKKSKEMCDFLIVGVSTDEVVQNYKHKVPVIPFRERMEIVKSIRYVDQVVPQLSMDKYQAWSKLHFDVMFHGDDWKGSDLYNDYEVKFKEIGVDIVYISHTKGISSSKIADEIKYGK